LQPNFIKGVGQLVAFGFTYDILIHQHQVQEAFNFAVKLPNVHFVLDHIAKPLIKKGEIQPGLMISENWLNCPMCNAKFPEW
jgi:L-fuconolactonase